MVSVTGAFLAENAGALDGKLHTWGGVLDTWQVGPDRTATWVLVVLLQHQASEGVAEGAALKIEIIDPAGETQHTINVDIAPEGLQGENAFAFFKIGVGLPIDGRYVLVVTGDAGYASVPIHIHS
jgi:hypothetical protein